MPKALTFLTAATPNGRRVSILLEELKVAYGIEFETKKIDFGKAEQKEPWFLKLNPNGRIPVLVDHQRDDFAVFESAAILLYLQEHYDKDDKFGFAKGSNEYSEILQWILFVHSAVAPIVGQAFNFLYHVPVKNEAGSNILIEEAKRAFGVLDKRLADRDWLVGPGRGKYTIADINALPWFQSLKPLGIDNIDQWPNIKAWFERGNATPTVKAGLASPDQSRL